MLAPLEFRKYVNLTYLRRKKDEFVIHEQDESIGRIVARDLFPDLSKKDA